MSKLPLTKARLQKKAKCLWEWSYPEVERSLGKSTGLQAQRVRGESYPEPNMFLILKTFLSATLILCTFGEELLCVYELNEPHFQKCLSLKTREAWPHPPKKAALSIQKQHEDRRRRKLLKTVTRWAGGTWNLPNSKGSKFRPPRPP